METPRENEPLENYLDRLCIWLVTMPEAEREDVRLELRQHFQSLAAAEVMGGATQAEAVTAALNRLGDADELGSRLKQAWQQKMERQMQQLMPATLHRLLGTSLLVIRCWGVVSLAFWLWLNIFMPYNSWLLDLTGSGVIGAGLGLLQRLYENKLSLLAPRMSKRQAQTLAEYAIALPPLPHNASSRSRAEYGQSLIGFKRVKEHLHRVAENPASQYRPFKPLPIPLQILAITALMIVGQSQSQSHTVSHGVFIMARQFAEFLTVFTARDIVTDISDRLARRKQAEQPS